MNDKLATALRYAGVSGATIITVLGALGSMDADTAHRATAALHGLMDGINQVWSNASILIAILGPIIAGILAKIGISTTGLVPALKKITAPNSGVKIEGQIVAPPAVAAAVPSEQVVAK